MPRVEKRVANKDYPTEGIKKGDTYYYTKIKLQRGGRVMRSLTPFKESQLTQSPFKSGWLAIQEDWEMGPKDADAMRAAADGLRELGEEAQGSFDNMPEGLQQGDTGQMLEARAEAAESAADELESLADELEALEEPEEPDSEEPEEPDSEDPEAVEEYEALLAEYESAQDDYETAQQEYESEIERITDAADDLISDMPE